MPHTFAVVTGASSGIGYELAKQFARNGFDLLVTAEDTGIQKAAADFEALGVRVEAVQADLATSDGVDMLYRAIQQSGRAVDAIALNAGVGVGGGDFTETSLEKELRMIDLNVKSTVHLAKHVVKDMVARGEGRILFTSSIASAMPGPYESVYAATKAFVEHFSQALRNELKDTGVTVTALLPGPTETNFFHRAGMDNTKVGQAKKDDPKDVAEAGFKALMDGDDLVVAGGMNKVQAALAKIMPEPLQAAMHGGMAQPVDKEAHNVERAKKKAG